MPDTSFSTMLAMVGDASKGIRLQLPEDWMQGRAGFGGLVGALALTSMQNHVPPARKVRSLLISFVGPVGPGDFSIHARVLRSGKAVTHVEARLVQQEAVRCVVMGSFGGDRDSGIRIDPAPRPEMAGPAEALELPYIEGLTPAFTRHFAYRWALGELPFSGKGGHEIGGWIQFREQTDCLTEAWLVALADAWPTPVLAMLTAPAAASTLNWEMGFVHLNRRTCTENDWWCYRSVADSAENGYVHERGAIWDPEGRLAVYSRQTSTVFA
ncbi:thioesterase family protein [uncultured Desulfosarcina sp.]|uniref:acyl-CoA thioesterase n=1 Tax=uncultured Desulfosarcina sp. TaxID=218289 RepID=UPI0029C7213D|nr:thioesterase family protein [uncultured Desulfosarcina sp.]